MSSSKQLFIAHNLQIRHFLYFNCLENYGVVFGNPGVLAVVCINFQMLTTRLIMDHLGLLYDNLVELAFARNSVIEKGGFEVYMY